MKIMLNGATHQTQAGNIGELLRELEMPERGIAVARNHQVVRRAEHNTTALQENDIIEIIRAVQGG